MTDDRFAALRAQLRASKPGSAIEVPIEFMDHAGMTYIQEPSTEAMLRLEVFTDFVIQHTARGCRADAALASMARQACDLVVEEARRLGLERYPEPSGAIDSSLPPVDVVGP